MCACRVGGSWAYGGAQLWHRGVPLKHGCGRAPVLGGGYSGCFLKTLVHISLAEGELQPKEGNSMSDLVSMARG